MANMGQIEKNFNMITGSMYMHTTRQGAWDAVHDATKRIVDEMDAKIGVRYGSAARRAYRAKVAYNYRKHVKRIYCGTAQNLVETAAVLYSFAHTYSWLPIGSSVAEFYAYVAEGDASNSALYGVLSLGKILSLGSLSLAKTGGKLAIGAGVKEAAKELEKKAASTLPGMGGKVTNVLIRGNVKTTFKHGDRHAVEIGLDPKVIENAIADDIQRIGVQGIREMRNGAGVDLVVDGTKLKYKLYVLDDNNVI